MRINSKISPADGPPLILVFDLRHPSERLTRVFLMDANDPTPNQRPVKALHNKDRDLPDSFRPGSCGRKPETARQLQAEVLVQVVVVEVPDIGFEDVGRWRDPFGNAPAS